LHHFSDFIVNTVTNTGGSSFSTRKLWQDLGISELIRHLNSIYPTEGTSTIDPTVRSRAITPAFCSLEELLNSNNYWRVDHPNVESLKIEALTETDFIPNERDNAPLLICPCRLETGSNECENVENNLSEVKQT